MRSQNPPFAWLLLVPAATLLFGVRSARASVTDVYVAQSQAGSADGSSCANAKAVTFFNAGPSWGSGAGQIGPGSTVHLCGTLTSPLVVGGSGSASGAVTVRWEAGASLAACDTTGAVQMPGRSYVVLDLGGSTAAVTCPNNGTALSTQLDAVGITDAGSGFDHIEIRNGTVGPMYLYSGTGNDGFGSTCINASQNAASSHFHHLTLKGCANAIAYGLGPSDSLDDEFDHLTTDSTVGRVINYASATDGATYTSKNASIHHLDVDYSTVWAVPGDYLHYEWIHLYNRGIAGSNDTISNLQIYDNYFHGMTPNNAGSTGGIFISEGGSDCNPSSSMSVKIFNNLVVNAPGGIGFSSGAGGFIYEQDCEHSVEVYSNTIDGGDSTTDSCFELNGTTGSSWIVKNNICMNTGFAFYNPQASGPSITSNGNIFYNVQSSGNGGYEWRNQVYNALGGWTSATGQDASSSTATPGLGADYRVSGPQSLANTLPGENLASLGIPALDSDKPLTVGAAGTDAATARPSVGPWTVGAYQYCAGNCSMGADAGEGGSAEAGPDGGPPGDAGAGESGGAHDGGADGQAPGDSGADAAAPGTRSGCGCTLAGRSASGAAWLAAIPCGLALLGRRRRRAPPTPKFATAATFASGACPCPSRSPPPPA